MLDVYAFITTIQLTDEEDYYEWEIQGKVSKSFNAGDVYTYLKGEIPTQNWTKIVWFPHAIPRHAIHSWLMLFNRCSTRDCLLRWGIQVDPVCLLCNTGVETRNHIYFEWNYSFDLWNLVTRRLRLTPSHSWDRTIAQLQSLPSDKYPRLLSLYWHGRLLFTRYGRKETLAYTLQSSDL